MTPEEREALRARLEGCRRFYEMDGNPLAVWEAYESARRAGEPVPEWVLEYLDRAAWNLLRIEATQKSINAKVVEALELKKPGRDGSGTAFSRAQDIDWILIGEDVRLRLPQCGGKEWLACEEVAGERGVSPSTARRAYKQVISTFFPEEPLSKSR